MQGATRNSSYNFLQFFVPLAVAILSLGVMLLALHFDWYGADAADCKKFCEAARSGLIKQQANTWSNMGFIIAGLVSAWLLTKGVFARNNNSLTRTIFPGIFFSSVVVFLGPGSMAMHASESALGLYLDRLSMYLIAALIFSYAAKRVFKLGASGFVATFAVALLICHIANFIEYSSLVWKNGVFGFLLGAGVVIELLIHLSGKSQIEFKWAIAAGLSFAMAFLIWIESLTGRPLCDPHSLLQGHALWHLLCALAMFFLFRYYVSENEIMEG